MNATPARTTAPRSAPPRRGTTPQAILLALCVLVAGCGGGDSLFGTTPPPQESTAGGSDTGRTTDTGGSTPGGPAVTATTDPVLADDPYIWVRIDASTPVFADGESYQLVKEDIAASDLGYVVVGYEVEQYPETQTYRNDGCRIWYSADGYEWRMLGYIGTSGKNWMHSVIAATPGFVAVGETSMGDDDPAVWVSPDATSWTQAWTAPGDGGDHVHAVAAGGPGFVAVGEAYPGEAAVWISPDGTSWERVADDSLGGPGALEIYDVVAGGPGLVAVGLEETADGYDGVVWTSPDGSSWTRVEDTDGVFAGPGSQQIRHVVAGGPGLVAVGVEEYADEVVWTSPDGLTWTREPPGSVVFRGPGGSFTAIAVGPSGPAAFWDGSIWLAVPCSASPDEIAAVADSAGGEIDDTACAGERARGG